MSAPHWSAPKVSSEVFLVRTYTPVWVCSALTCFTPLGSPLGSSSRLAMLHPLPHRRSHQILSPDLGRRHSNHRSMDDDIRDCLSLPKPGN